MKNTALEKVYLSPKQRYESFVTGLQWLSIVYIDVYSHEEKRWSVERISLRDRWDCFYSCLDTAIRGYVYKVL